MSHVQAQIEKHYHSELVESVRAQGGRLRFGTTTLHLAKEFGFCYGVERAIDLAYAAGKVFSDRNIYLLGEIIHNPDVNAQIEALGIHCLPHRPKPEDLAVLKPEDVVIVPAFGAEASLIALVKQIGCQIVDTTCGDVMSVWKRVRQNATEGVTSIIHGKADHEETRATASRALGADGQGQYLIVLDMEETRAVADYILHGGDPAAFLQRFAGKTSEHFNPVLAPGYAETPFVLLGNIGPDLQNHVLDQVKNPKFIIADTPGHTQYTRNMVTGASTANLAIILIDARKGVIEQTKRHSFIANLLRIQHLVVAVNKMDLVDYSEEVYNKIIQDFRDFASRLDNIVEITDIPISALNGDNVVDKSEHMPWYQGPTFLYHLEHVYVGGEENHVDARFPVQWVIRPMSDEWHDFRGYAGRVAGGVFKPGDEVTVLPSGFKTRVKAIHSPDGEQEEAFAPQSVCITLTEEIDISRGDTLVKTNNPPEVSQDIEAMICWFSNKPMPPRAKLVIRHTTQETKAIIQDVKYHVDINTLHKIEGVDGFAMNDIGRITLRTAVPLIHDSYRRNRATGSFILIDPGTNETVAAGMIV